MDHVSELLPRLAHGLPCPKARYHQDVVVVDSFFGKTLKTMKVMELLHAHVACTAKFQYLSHVVMGAMDGKIPSSRILRTANLNSLRSSLSIHISHISNAASMQRHTEQAAQWLHWAHRQRQGSVMTAPARGQASGENPPDQKTHPSWPS